MSADSAYAAAICHLDETDGLDFTTGPGKGDQAWIAVFPALFGNAAEHLHLRITCRYLTCCHNRQRLYCNST